MFLGSKARRVRRADNLTTICGILNIALFFFNFYFTLRGIVHFQTIQDLYTLVCTETN
jgi:hypothetical protein